MLVRRPHLTDVLVEGVADDITGSRHARGMAGPAKEHAVDVIDALHSERRSSECRCGSGRGLLAGYHGKGRAALLGEVTLWWWVFIVLTCSSAESADIFARHSGDGWHARDVRNVSRASSSRCSACNTQLHPVTRGDATTCRDTPQAVVALAPGAITLHACLRLLECLVLHQSSETDE